MLRREYVPESLRTARDRLGGGASNDVMAYYLVRAKPKPERLGELQNRLQEDAFIDLRPFGKALTRSLKEARTQSDVFQIVNFSQEILLLSGTRRAHTPANY